MPKTPSCGIQAMSTLNHAGICMLAVQTWNYLRQLSAEARYLEVIKSGRWIWVYDNLNIHKAVRHERQGMGMCSLAPSIFTAVFVACRGEKDMGTRVENVYASWFRSLIYIMHTYRSALDNAEFDSTFSHQHPESPRLGSGLYRYNSTEKSRHTLHK